MNIDSIKRRVDKLAGTAKVEEAPISVYLVGVNPDGTRAEPVLCFSAEQIIEEREKNK